MDIGNIAINEYGETVADELAHALTYGPIIELRLQQMDSGRDITGPFSEDDMAALAAQVLADCRTMLGAAQRIEDAVEAASPDAAYEWPDELPLEKWPVALAGKLAAADLQTVHVAAFARHAMDALVLVLLRWQPPTPDPFA